MLVPAASPVYWMFAPAVGAVLVTAVVLVRPAAVLVASGAACYAAVGAPPAVVAVCGLVNGCVGVVGVDGTVHCAFAGDSRVAAAVE